MNMFKKNGGFTLVELIVVIAILAILAGVAIPAYSGYITKAQDAAVITELDAIQTAAQAANATAGEITKIEVPAAGNKVKVYVTDPVKIAEKFASDFDIFYGTTSTTAAGGSASIEVDITAVDLTKSSYKNGATWYATDPEGAAVAGWNANPAQG